MLTSYFQAFFYDSDHSYLRQSRKRRSRSFVQNFLKLHFLLLDDGVSINITFTSGSGADLTGSSTPSIFRATSAGRSGGSHSVSSVYRGSSEVGIVVGTGTTAVAPTDFSLATKIVDGITAGTLEYFPCSGTGLTISAPTGSFVMERLLRNSSSGSITINEVGIYALTNGSSDGWDACCIIRDLVSPGFVIANGEYMRIIYTLSVTA